MAKSLNNISAKHEYINIVHGLLTALQKFGQPKAPTKSLRPVLLLLMLRKIISNIVLTRVQPTFQQYLSHSQCTYRHGRSISDIVWCNRFLAARVQNIQEEIMITGIDMTSAYDTIQRTKLIEILESFLREDEIRIIRVLLSNTTLDIKSSSSISNPFDVNLSSPQGDGISGCPLIIPWESLMYYPWPGRQQPCKWWAFLCSQFQKYPTRWVHLCWWHRFNQRLCREEEKTVTV